MSKENFAIWPKSRLHALDMSQLRRRQASVQLRHPEPVYAFLVRRPNYDLLAIAGDVVVKNGHVSSHHRF
jgi:hypothetical protein